MTKGFIYIIKCIPSGKIYIGQTVNFDKRIKQHLYYLRLNKHQNNFLQDSFNKYGEENFEYSVIERCEIEIMNDRENFYFKQYNSIAPFGFNLKDIESHGLHSEITKQKCRESNLIVMNRPEMKKKLSEIKKKQLANPKERERLRVQALGNKHRAVKVEQIDLKTGKIIKVWESIVEALLVLKGTKKGVTNISKVCNGLRKQCLGYGWKYAA